MNDEAATHHPVISLLSRDYSYGVYNTHCGEKCQDWNPILKFKANVLRDRPGKQTKHTQMMRLMMTMQT